MIFKYFGIFNLISIIFGVGKALNKSGGAKLLLKLWSLLIAIALSTGCVVSVGKDFEFNIRRHLEEISIINNNAVNVLVILTNIINGDGIIIDIYEVLNKTMKELNVSDRSCKLMAIKLFIWFSVPTISYIILIIMEIIETKPPFVLLTRIPTYLSIMHLMIHLNLLLAALKIINGILSEMLMYNKIPNTIVNNSKNYTTKLLKYLLHHNIRFIEVSHQISQVNVKFLCKAYDNLVTCLQLLEKYHGMQILLTIWLMFSSAVFGITLINCKQATHPWLVIASSVLPFFWCCIGCYIEDQLHVEVEFTETLILKYMIDYRCDQTVKNSLQTFKQLLGSNRLQFAACNLFHLNYSMLLGAIMNIITYSIILIQLFVNQKS